MCGIGVVCRPVLLSMVVLCMRCLFVLWVVDGVCGMLWVCGRLSVFVGGYWCFVGGCRRWLFECCGGDSRGFLWVVLGGIGLLWYGVGGCGLL